MTSEETDEEISSDEAYVWIWLPDAVDPVVAGRIAKENDLLVFNYGRSYLERNNAIAIFQPELPLQAGRLPLLNGLKMPSCLRDAAPDAWGRRVIINRKLGFKAEQIDIGHFGEMTYLIESGSDRIGALDFQHSPTRYVPRGGDTATLEELLAAAEQVEDGIPIPPDLNQALFHGSEIGGARPKANIQSMGRKYIAKFSSQSDVFNVVKGEFVAMRLAALAGLNVANVELTRAAGKDIILIERFDRLRGARGWQRKAMVSALTLFGLDEMMARYASYQDLAEIIRHRFISPTETLHELFGRLVFNILCGNTDDHARNHAAFWDGHTLSLTPAYDICPQARTGGEASQAMLILGNNRMSQLTVCLEAAPQFQLSHKAAMELIEMQLVAIRDHWPMVCDEAALKQIERNALWHRQLLNRFAFQDAPATLAKFAKEQ